ncbi:hypothetical protein [Streptomyces sp. WAC 06783]|uniref:hypothetical protein n=1 Tax=Streptomyces sp. WAC 06783 TaxID=2203211 RepID=UPI000F7470EE|nr:hypothetical protein [Streptomyces sp. WAC 06783]
MIIWKVLTGLGLTAAATGAGLVAAAPAAAGGILVFLSPAYDNSCASLGHAKTAGSTTQGAGTVGGLLAAAPVSSPTNQCGGADVHPPLYKVKVLSPRPGG